MDIHMKFCSRQNRQSGQQLLTLHMDMIAGVTNYPGFIVNTTVATCFQLCRQIGVIHASSSLWGAVCKIIHKFILYYKIHFILIQFILYL